MTEPGALSTAIVGAGPAGLAFAAIGKLLHERAGDAAGPWELRLYDKRESYVRTHRLRIAREPYEAIAADLRDPRFDALLSFLRDEDFRPEVNRLEERLSALVEELGIERETLEVEGVASLRELVERHRPHGRVTIVGADSVHSAVREATAAHASEHRHVHQYVARLRVLGPGLPVALGPVAQVRLSKIVAVPLVSACGGAPTAHVQTGHADSADRIDQPSAHPDRLEAEAREAIEALGEIPRLCITPERCEELRAWRPERLDVLDGHPVAMGREHAFVRVDGRWAHHAIPLHNEPMSNGHAAFFCDHEGNVHELTTEGLRRRGTLPSPQCAAVVAAGAQLYVVVGDGPILRQEGNAWVPLAIELPYGNGYSVNTVVMTPTRAFLVDRAARLLELPSMGPSHEPRVVAETGLGHMTTLRAVPGSETIVALDREMAIIEDGSVRRIPLPSRASEASTSNEAGGEGDEEDFEEEEGGADGIRQISETELEMGMWIVGLEPLILARSHVVMAPGSPQGELTLDHYVLGPSGWSLVTPRSPESFVMAFGAGGFDTTLPDRTSPVHVGPYRVVVSSYHRGARGPVVTAWPHDGVDVALTVFPPE